MSNLIKLPPKVEEETIEESKEEEPIFKDDPKPDLNIEPVKEEKKTKRTRTMTDDAKKQLNDARARSIATRKANALKKKQEKEEKELTNQKYINEIDLLKQQIEELKNTKPQEKVVYKEKEVYKEREDDNDYKFSMEDLDFYAKEYLKKTKEAEDEIKNKRNQDIRNKYFLNMR